MATEKDEQQNPAKLGLLAQGKDAEKHRNSWQQGQKTAQRGQRLQANGQERQRHARCFIGLCHLRSSRQDRPHLRGKRDELQNWYQDDGKDQKQRQPQLGWARNALASKRRPQEGAD